MSLLTFNQIKASQLSFKEHCLFVRTRRGQVFEDALISCRCYHLDCEHDNTGKCSHQLYCDCKRFVAREIDLKVTITYADIFEFETPDHSERDSLQWWSEMESWIKNHELAYNI